MRSLRRSGSFAALAMTAAMLIGAAGGAQAADGALLFETCIGCHGIENYKNNYPTYRVPKLGGQDAAYIVAALQGYKAGTRPHPTMQAQAASMSDADMQALGAYLAAMAEISTETRGTAPDSAATCTACHGTNGRSAGPTFPSLAGQHADYIEASLRQYKAGTRQNAIMAGFSAALDEKAIKQLAAFYSAQKGLVTVEK